VENPVMLPALAELVMCRVRKPVWVFFEMERHCIAVAYIRREWLSYSCCNNVFRNAV